jgi:hypothetical protein
MQPLTNGPRRKDLRRAMHTARDTRPVHYRPGAHGVPVATSPDYQAGQEQGRADYARGWFAIPAGASPAWADGYRLGYPRRLVTS